MVIFRDMCLECDLPDHTSSVKNIRGVLWLHFWHLCYKTNLKLKNGKLWHQADHRRAIDCNRRKEASG